MLAQALSPASGCRPGRAHPTPCTSNVRPGRGARGCARRSTPRVNQSIRPVDGEMRACARACECASLVNRDVAHLDIVQNLPTHILNHEQKCVELNDDSHTDCAVIADVRQPFDACLVDIKDDALRNVHTAKVRGRVCACTSTTLLHFWKESSVMLARARKCQPGSLRRREREGSPEDARPCVGRDDPRHLRRSVR
jgi:hypothetical protein